MKWYAKVNYRLSPPARDFRRAIKVVKELRPRGCRGLAAQAIAKFSGPFAIIGRAPYHGLFVLIYGGIALGDEGLVSVQDEDGKAFDRNLHETCFKFWLATHP